MTNLEKAEALRAEGNALESTGTEASLDEAISRYRSAFALLSRLVNSDVACDATLSRELGLSRMNEGNAWMKRAALSNGRSCIQEAVTAYETSIKWLDRLSSTDESLNENGGRDQNTLGAAWMNLGQALHALGAREPLERAISAFDRAIALFSELPLEASEWHRLNRVGAEVNRANALLSRVEFHVAGRLNPFSVQAESDPVLSDLESAREGARLALSLIVSIEETSPAGAHLGLKARRVLCDVLGQLLPRITESSEAANEAVETADAGLALYRRWPQHAVEFEPLALRLFQFGATVYRIHQPHFLAEFLEENGVFDRKAWRGIARAEIALAEKDVQRVQRFSFGERDSDRRLETARALAQLSAELAVKDAS